MGVRTISIPSQQDDQQAGELTKTIGLLDLVMLSAGAAIGVSIFSVLAPAARIAGSGLLISAVVAATPMAFFACVYAFMASIAPRSGASYEWPREFIHPFFGFLVAWLRILGSVGVLVTLSFVFVQYMSMVVHLPATLTMFVLLSCVFAVNIRGLRISARAQSIAMLTLLTVLAAFVLFGVVHVHPATIGNPLAQGLVPILAAVPLLIPLYLGIETATEVGQEVRNARRTIPLALGLALAMTLIVFLAVALTCLGLLGPKSLAAASAPLIDAGRQSLGSAAVPLVLIAAGLAILKSLNSIFIVFSRYLFAMARAGVLPSAMGRVHSQWGTPHIATVVAFACAAAGLFLPRNLVFLFIAISVPTVLKYLSTCLCALRIVRRWPELAQQSSLNFRLRTISVLAGLGIASACLILAVGLEADWRPYVLMIVWGLLGIGYYFWYVGWPTRAKVGTHSG